MQRRLACSLVASMAACLLFFGNPSPVSAEVRYTVTDLSAIWEATNPAMRRAIGYTIPPSRSLSDLGQVIGAYVVHMDTGAVQDFPYSILWDPVLGLREFHPLSVPVAVSDRGLMVGRGTAGLFLWDRDRGNREAWRYDRMYEVLFHGINDSGVAVGDQGVFGGRVAITWDTENGIHSLGAFGADFARGTAINNQGQVLGCAESGPIRFFTLDDDFVQSVEREDFWFFWDPDTGMQNLGNTTDSEFIAINDLGQVIGSGHRSVPGRELPSPTHNALLRWQDAVMSVLETLDNGELNVGGANNLGEIVGNVVDHSDDVTREYAFLWNATGGLQDLNDLVTADLPWRITWGRDINNRGEIVCEALDVEGHERVLMLTPVPEPTTYVFLAGGSAMMLIFFTTLNSGRLAGVWRKRHAVLAA